MKTVEVELPGRADELHGPPGIAYAHAPLAPDDEGRAGAGRRPAPWASLRVAVRRDARERGARQTCCARQARSRSAIVDTGADVTHPDLAAKAPETWDVVHRRTSVADRDGHGTFVSALAAGSVTNDEGIAGFGGDAQLLMVKAVGAVGQLQRRRRGGRDRLRRRPRREDRQPQPRRCRRIRARAARDRVRGEPRRPARRRGRERVLRPATRSSIRPRRSSRRARTARAASGSRSPPARWPASARASRTPAHRSRSRLPARTSSARSRPARRATYWPRYALPGSHAGLYGWSSGTSFSTPGGRRRGRARLGGEPGSHRAAGRGDPQVDRVRRRPVEPAARLRRDRRRGRGRSRARPAGRARASGPAPG